LEQFLFVRKNTNDSTARRLRPTKHNGMNQEEYLKQRVDDQFNWLDRKSIWNQKRYKRLRTVVLFVSVLIPLLSGWIGKLPELSYAVGIGGVIIAICEGLISLNKYQENWTAYRATAESLKRERLLFLTKTGPYIEKEKPFPHFVQRVETLLGAENEQWLERIKEDNKNEDQEA